MIKMNRKKINGKNFKTSSSTFEISIITQNIQNKPVSMKTIQGAFGMIGRS